MLSHAIKIMDRWSSWLVCKHTPCRIKTYIMLSARSLTLTGVPMTKEPRGLTRTDGMRPYGLTLAHSQAGKSLITDLGCYGSQHTIWLLRSPIIPVCWWSSWGRGNQKNYQVRLSFSRLHFSAADVWDSRRHGATHSSALDFLNAVGGWPFDCSVGDPRETTFLW